MFDRILVALDRSDYSNVFTQALSLARNTDATLMLLHVLSQQEKGSPVRIFAPYYDPIINDAAEELYQSQWERFEQEGLERLHRLCDQAAAKGVRTKITQLYGDPSRQICALPTGIVGLKWSEATRTNFLELLKKTPSTQSAMSAGITVDGCGEKLPHEVRGSPAL